MKLEVNNISLNYMGHSALNNISFNVQDGETVSILGPSGCGKSSLLNIISGILSPHAGSIYYNGNDITSKTGIISYMQQKDLLLPWKSILDNVVLGGIFRGEKIENIRIKALSLFDEFGLKGFENHYPDQLSGGMKQRAAFLRTFLFTEKIMLLDEPFSGLDAITRHNMQKWLQTVQQHHKFSLLLVTHDIDEAILLSDRIVILSPAPASLSGICDVPLPHPRNDFSLLDNTVIEIKKRINDILQG